MFWSTTPPTTSATPSKKSRRPSGNSSIALNLRPQFFAIQAVLPAMRAAGRGSIINMSSISWMIPSTGVPLYIAAKAAIVGLTRTLAHELGPANIRVNAVLPGAIATERQKRLWYTPAIQSGNPRQPGAQARHPARRRGAIGALPRRRRLQRHHQPELHRRRRLGVESLRPKCIVGESRCDPSAKQSSLSQRFRLPPCRF